VVSPCPVLVSVEIASGCDGQLARSLVMSRPIILTFVEYYLPGFKSGGPIRSIANMVDALGDEFEFRIVTSDRDSLDVAPYYGITSDAWVGVRKAWVYYVSPERRRLFAWARLIRETPHDVLYLNSLFNPVYTLLPLLARRLAGSQRKPVIVAPRGEFSTGAMGLKRWKKRPFLAFAQIVGLYRNILWHASTEDEAQLIRRQFGGAARIVTARDLPPMSGQQPTACEAIDASGRLRIVFLSRISRMKNLDYALRVLAKTPVRIQFDIWGTLEDPAYWNKCQDQIRSLPENVVARYRGVADHYEVNKILAGYDLLFLPTRGENYGHVIAEAVSAGTPVLLSDQTPWRNLHNEGVGWDLPLENGEAAFLEAIEEALHKVGLERVAWRQRVLDFATERLHDPSLIEANRALFLQAVANKV
jgi:glycosyltransferase involved in cell wall biosynthesis